MLLAIETSCDETAVAVLDRKAYEAGAEDFLRADLISSQIKLHQAYGGVVPELAAREHLINLPYMVEEALKKAGVSLDEITAVACTRGPGLKGCLLVGLSFAKMLALGRKLPLLALHHIEGHLLAANLLPLQERPDYPALALVVSGGHTQLVHIPRKREYEIVAKTRDDAAGEAFDKAATLLNLPYPGGPNLSARAAGGNQEAYPLPVALADDPGSFSFSGLKTAIQRTVLQVGAEIERAQVVDDLSASVEHAIVRALLDKSLRACEKYRPRSFILTGGVAANTTLRNELADALAQRGIKFCVPERKWCTDNAAMIAVLAAEVIAERPEDYAAWAPKDGYLGPQTRENVGALPKWPLTEAGAAA